MTRIYRVTLIGVGLFANQYQVEEKVTNGYDWYRWLAIFGCRQDAIEGIARSESQRSRHLPFEIIPEDNRLCCGTTATSCG